MERQEILKLLVREILNNDEDAAVESLAMLWGFARQGRFMPDMRQALKDGWESRDA
jgi:hypothetical protein